MGFDWQSESCLVGSAMEGWRCQWVDFLGGDSKEDENKLAACGTMALRRWRKEEIWRTKT